MDQQPEAQSDVVGKGLIDHVVAVSLGFGMIGGISLLCIVRYAMKSLILLLRAASAKASSKATQMPSMPPNDDKSGQAKHLLSKAGLLAAQLLSLLIAYALEVGVIFTIIGEVLTREVVAGAGFVFCGLLALSLEHAALSRRTLRSVAFSTRFVFQRRWEQGYGRGGGSEAGQADEGGEPGPVFAESYAWEPVGDDKGPLTSV